MSSKMTHAAVFLLGTVAGACIGVVVGCTGTWKLAKKQHEEEIRSVKETYSRRGAVVVKPVGDDDDAEKMQQRKESVVAYAERLRIEGYLSGEGEKQEDPHSVEDTPYVISPDEFGEMDGYETVSLTFYSDGTLADDNDEMIEDIEEIVGSDFRDHFGEYEEDSVFVRNDKRKCDYEILADQRPYSDILKAKPYLRREE